MTDLPFSASRTKVSWFKDGHPINTANPIISTRIQIFGQYSEQLKINSVRPEDVGLYQCFLTTNTAQEFQAASELRLGGRCCANLPIFYFKLKYFNTKSNPAKLMIIHYIFQMLVRPCYTHLLTRPFSQDLGFLWNAAPTEVQHRKSNGQSMVSIFQWMKGK